MVSGEGRLESTFMASPVIDKGGYMYFVNPISDGIPVVEPELLEEICDRILEKTDLDCDIMLAPEAMGIHLATALSMRSGRPFAVIRKKMYGLPGEIPLNQETGYSKSPMYVNGVKEGDRVVLIDDVISTGGTMRSVVAALRSKGVVVTEIVVVYDKNRDIEAFAEELGVKITSLIRVGVKDGKPVILE